MVYRLALITDCSDSTAWYVEKVGTHALVCADSHHGGEVVTKSRRLIRREDLKFVRKEHKGAADRGQPGVEPRSLALWAEAVAIAARHTTAKRSAYCLKLRGRSGASLVTVIG